MAIESHDTFFLGTDLQRKFHILNEAQDAAIDITGWGLSWMLKKNLGDLDAAALLTKTTAAASIVISGTYNADPTINQQRATVTIADTDTDAFNEGLANFEVKRTDAGLETVLAYGPEVLVRGVHRT